ncbi:unnamed protein product [Polarella glacialis]|uniref:Uncharacterized protein n=1 Tax=Polarella glacialis TaxID=89957 RepID=A0A813F9N4_POLGL|nr:unnamed protein product [Polarella glacialis]
MGQACCQEQIQELHEYDDVPEGCLVKQLPVLSSSTTTTATPSTTTTTTTTGSESGKSEASSSTESRGYTPLPLEEATAISNNNNNLLLSFGQQALHSLDPLACCHEDTLQAGLGREGTGLSKQSSSEEGESENASGNLAVEQPSKLCVEQLPVLGTRSRSSSPIASAQRQQQRQQQQGMRSHLPTCALQQVPALPSSNNNSMASHPSTCPEELAGAATEPRRVLEDLPAATTHNNNSNNNNTSPDSPTSEVRRGGRSKSCPPVSWSCRLLSGEVAAEGLVKEGLAVAEVLRAIQTSAAFTRAVEMEKCVQIYGTDPAILDEDGLRQLLDEATGDVVLTAVLQDIPSPPTPRAGHETTFDFQRGAWQHLPKGDPPCHGRRCHCDAGWLRCPMRETW